MPARSLPISTHDVLRGYALTACPHCYNALHIRIPLLEDILTSWEGPAVRLGVVDRLTPGTARLFDVLWTNRPHGVPRTVLQERLNMTDVALRVALRNIRARLGPLGWGVTRTPGSARLIEPAPPP